MKKFGKIIFVSMNNTCRGPMAEVIMKMLTKHKELEIISRGLIVLFPEPCNPKAVAVLRSKGIILDNRSSVELTEAEITDDTLILALGIKEKEMLIEKYDPANLYTISEFAGEPGGIVDPYGKDIDSYKECADVLTDRIKKIDERLMQMEQEEEQ